MGHYKQQPNYNENERENHTKVQKRHKVNKYNEKIVIALYTLYVVYNVK